MIEISKDYKYLKECTRQIEDRLSWGSSEHWHSSVFEELSRIILNKTNVMLSPTTLKRVWGKINHSGFPSIKTLNTLAEFIDYLNWRDFKINSGVKNSKIKSISIKNKKIKKIALFGIIVITFIYCYLSIENKKEFDLYNLDFSSRKITKGIPNSVVFDFDLSGVESDSIHIQQYWDETKTIKLTSNQTQAVGQYYFPGYFRAKLLVDGDIKKEHDLFIKSNGWIGTIDYEPIPKYFKQSPILNNSLKLPDSVYDEIRNSEKPLLSSYHFIEDFGNFSADNFVLNTSLRSIYRDKWAVCQKVFITVIGTKSSIIIPFSIPGCVSEINLMIGEKKVSGNKTDLSVFGVDFSDFKNIKLLVKNKNVNISIDGKLIFRDSYDVSVGNIVGVRYRFLGIGEVDYLNLSDLKGHSINKNDFSF